MFFINNCFFLSIIVLFFYQQLFCFYSITVYFYVNGYKISIFSVFISLTRKTPKHNIILSVNLFNFCILNKLPSTALEPNISYLLSIFRLSNSCTTVTASSSSKFRFRAAQETSPPQKQENKVVKFGYKKYILSLAFTWKIVFNSLKKL